MKRIPAVLLAGLLLAGRPVTAAEFQPSDYYTTAFTFLGSVGGAVLGASIAGLSRPTGSSAVRPFMQWGAAGSVAGALLGRDLAQFSLEQDTDMPGPKRVSTPEANACLGALGGQLAGYVIVAVANDPIHRDDRTVWAGIALGTLVGSAVGYFLPPIPLITLPPEQSRRERALEINSSRMEPLIPAGGEAPGIISGAEAVPAESLPPTRPFLPESKLVKLDSLLQAPENDRDMAHYRPVFPNGSPAEAHPLVSPRAKADHLDTAPPIQLAALAGFCLGSAGGASLGGSRSVMFTRLGVGGAAGLVGGWAYARSALSPDRNLSNEEMDDMGHFLSMASAWTIAGTMVGIGSGAVFRNNFAEFRMTDSAHVTMGFAWLGLVGGALTSSF